VRYLAGSAQSGIARSISNAIVPLIVVAEGCSWYAVTTTSYLGNTLENSLWALTFLVIAAALLLLLSIRMRLRTLAFVDAVALANPGGIPERSRAIG
jgi:hypothetical protein